MQSKVYVSYSPARQGSVFALLYFESGSDIYGWHIEARGLYFSAAFFVIENFYEDRAPRMFRSVEDDVYGPWTMDYPPVRDEIRCPAPGGISHELERLQSKFVEEWLFFRNEPRIEAELKAYREADLPIQEVNIKYRRLTRLHKHDDTWTHATPGMDLNVVQMLRKYWRLSEKLPST